MRIVHPAAGQPRRLGILAGSFNPPTLAHVALIESAAGHVDEVLCVLPRVFPHKTYHGATLEQRIEMLAAARPAVPACSVGVSERGLFLDIARECREAYGAGVDLWFLCGRDAAERIIEWDYGGTGALDRMFESFGLLVASRRGPFVPPPEYAHRIANIAVASWADEISSTEVRERIARGGDWEHLVPSAIAELARTIYL